MVVDDSVLLDSVDELDVELTDEVVDDSVLLDSVDELDVELADEVVEDSVLLDSVVLELVVGPDGEEVGLGVELLSVLDVVEVGVGVVVGGTVSVVLDEVVVPIEEIRQEHAELTALGLASQFSR